MKANTKGDDGMQRLDEVLADVSALREENDCGSCLPREFTEVFHARCQIGSAGGGTGLETAEVVPSEIDPDESLPPVSASADAGGLNPTVGPILTPGCKTQIAETVVRNHMIDVVDVTVRPDAGREKPCEPVSFVTVPLVADVDVALGHRAPCTITRLYEPISGNLDPGENTSLRAVGERFSNGIRGSHLYSPLTKALVRAGLRGVRLEPGRANGKAGRRDDYALRQLPTAGREEESPLPGQGGDMSELGGGMRIQRARADAPASFGVVADRAEEPSPAHDRPILKLVHCSSRRRPTRYVIGPRLVLIMGGKA